MTTNSENGRSQISELVIRGAGVVGMTGADAQARRVHRVTVIDEGSSTAANGASFGNGAQLSYAYSDAPASSGLVRNLPRLLLGWDEAFRNVDAHSALLTLSPAPRAVPGARPWH